jgi:D-lactate dehydrogenase (cytochrome)
LRAKLQGKLTNALPPTRSCSEYAASSRLQHGRDESSLPPAGVDEQAQTVEAGLGKQKYMREEHGDPALAAMRAVKAALDPQNIMNPGKILPP